MNLSLPFEFGARVIADGDSALTMIVTAVLSRPGNYITAECS